MWEWKLYYYFFKQIHTKIRVDLQSLSQSDKFWGVFIGERLCFYLPQHAERPLSCSAAQTRIPASDNCPVIFWLPKQRVNMLCKTLQKQAPCNLQEANDTLWIFTRHAKSFCLWAAGKRIGCEGILRSCNFYWNSLRAERMVCISFHLTLSLGLKVLFCWFLFIYSVLVHVPVNFLTFFCWCFSFLFFLRWPKHKHVFMSMAIVSLS